MADDGPASDVKVIRAWHDGPVMVWPESSPTTPKAIATSLSLAETAPLSKTSSLPSLFPPLHQFQKAINQPRRKIPSYSTVHGTYPNPLFLEKGTHTVHLFLALALIASIFQTAANHPISEYLYSVFW